MDTTSIILIALCLALVLCPPRYDPAIRLKEWLWRDRTPPKPSCYADYPFLNGQDAAERDCHHCSHAYGCSEDSPHPRKRP
jgi:hypothetical protein